MYREHRGEACQACQAFLGCTVSRQRGLPGVGEDEVLCRRDWECLGPEEVGHVMGVGREVVREWIEAGAPFEEVAGRERVDLRGLVKWLRQTGRLRIGKPRG